MKRKLSGIIVSDKMKNTVVVEVRTQKEHPKYRQRFFIDKKYKAHVQASDYKVGDKVVIEETNPISKDKKWKVLSKTA